MDGSDPQLRRQSVDAEEAGQIYELYRGDPVVFMCRNLIVSALLSNGIEVQGESGGEMTPAFQAIFQRYWVPFTRDLIDAFFMFGYAPWLKVDRPVQAHGPKRGKKAAKPVAVPILPPFGTYTVTTVVDGDYVQQLEFVPNGARGGRLERSDPRVGMLVATDGMPGITDGRHRSLTATLLPQFRIMQTLYRGTLLADHTRSHPPLITQSSPDKARMNDTGEEEPFGDPEEILEEIEAKRYRKSRADIAAIRQQRALTNNLNRRGAQTLLDPFSSSNRRLDTAQSYEDNNYHLPEGMQVAPQPPLPPLRNDLMDIERERVSIVCGCFGVPQSLILGGGQQRGRAAGEVEYRQLMRTIDGVASNVVMALTEVYRSIYPGETVVFSLPMMPLTTIENLLLVYREGVISKQTEGERLLRAAGLPASDLAIHPEMFPLGGNISGSSGSAPGSKQDAGEVADPPSDNAAEG